MTSPDEAGAAERVAFEEWLQREQMLTAKWVEARNCYIPFPAHLAYRAWLAAKSPSPASSTQSSPAP